MGLVQKAFSDIITFSRSSNATRIGPTGRVEYAPHNLLTYSEQFDNAAWAVLSTAGSVIANATVSPNGTVTADSFIPNTTNIATHRVAQSLSTASGIFTVSVYVKANGYSRFLIFLNGPNQSAVFNLATQTVTADTRFAAAPSNMAITSVGNGWYRCSFTTNISSDINYVQVNCLNSVAAPGDSWAGDGTSGIFIWGAQLSVGSYPLDYTPTTSAAVYGPRFDYDPVTLAARGLLVEESRSNLLTYSEQFDNAAYVRYDVTVAANSSTAPDGTVTADKVTPNTTNSFHLVQGGLVTISGAATMSVFAKADGYNRISLRESSATGNGALFDLSTGTVVTTNNATASITLVGNGWYRCSATITWGTNYSWGVCVGNNSASSTFPSFSGDGTSGVFLWGAQLEAGSFATSYIPTIASTVTRSADVASVNTLSPWFNSSEGSFYVEAATLATSTGWFSLLQPQANTLPSDERISLGVTGSNANSLYVLDNGAIQVNGITSGGSMFANSAVAKTAFRYKVNDFAISGNGATVSTDTSGSLPTIDKVLLGDDDQNRKLNGHLRRVAYYPRALTSAELQALTA